MVSQEDFIKLNSQKYKYDIDLVNVTLANLDGHTSAAACYFNVAVTDTDMSATGTMTMSGTIVITWTNLGDY